MNLENGFLKTLISQSSKGEALLRFLPPKTAEKVQSLSITPAIQFDALLSPTKWCEPIHYSWYVSILKEMPTPSQTLFLTLLPSKLAAQVATALSLSEDTTPLILSEIVIPPLAAHLKQKMQHTEIQPEPLLPLSELNKLLKLEKKQLILLIDYLGIHDLAADLRQVVDQTLIAKVHKALSKDQLTFLQYCIKQPLKGVPKKLGLSGWDSTKKQLNLMIHRRGLARLARAFVEENESLRWHLLHRLDTGRAEYIQKVLYERQDPALTPYFKAQVLHILKRFR